MEIWKYINEKVPNYRECICQEYVCPPKRNNFNCLGWTHLIVLISFTIIVAVVAFSNERCYSIYTGIGTISTRVNVAVDTTQVDIDELNMEHPELYRRVWAPEDYVFPHTQRHLKDFTVMTNVVMIPDQSLGTCPGINRTELECHHDWDCDAKNVSQMNDAGILTGKCVKDLKENHNPNRPAKRCEMNGYCPPYTSHKTRLPFNGTRALLQDVGTDVFFVIKSAVYFPTSGRDEYFWNFFPKSKDQKKKLQPYLNTCFYHPENNPNCPKFRIGDIVEAAGGNFSEFAIKGAIIKVTVHFDCHFPTVLREWLESWGMTKWGPTCEVTYSYKSVHQQNTELFAPSWNYDCSIQVEEDRRHFRECFGIKVNLEVEGRAKQLTFEAIFINTLLSSASFLFLPGLVIEWIVLRHLVDRKTLKADTQKLEHPDVRLFRPIVWRLDKNTGLYDVDNISEGSSNIKNISLFNKLSFVR